VRGRTGVIRYYPPRDPGRKGVCFRMARIEDSMNISYRQLDHWCKEGYLKPEGGNGTQRVWPEGEIRVGRMMSHLVAIGIKPEKAAVYAREAVVNKKPMLLAFEGGKLKARGLFSRAVKASLPRRDSEAEDEKAC
jgi:DNA-binding transcriptional MerR regulator